MKSMTLKVEGMCCAGCESTIQAVLGKMDGIVSSTANLALETVTVEYESTQPKNDDLKAAIAGVGYQVVD